MAAGEIGASWLPRSIVQSRLLRRLLITKRVDRVLQIRHDGQINISAFRKTCQAPRQKIFRFSEYANRATTFPARAAMRGRNAIVTERWRGLRWTLRRQAGSFPPDETFAADGEVVWSWRRDPGVYPRRPVLVGQR